MIIGIGIDLALASRIEKLIVKFEDKFIDKIFTKSEINCANEKKNLELKSLFYAKRFAAKEAFSKALGLGIGRGINFLDIEIFNDSFGCPKINILNGKEEFLKQHFNCEKLQIHLSLSDENKMAIAQVIIEKI
jgi:holo-[acyl-carrier protein] synthase